MKLFYLYINFIILIFLPSGNIYLQTLIPEIQIEKTIVVNNPVIISDSLTILPSSVNIFTQDSIFLKINNDYYPDNNRIILKTASFKKYKDSVLTVQYRTLMVNLGRYYFHLDSIALKKSEKAIYIGYDLGKNEKQVIPIMPSGLDYDGSFSRGFSIGNRQNLVMNSNLNLQMEGDIGSGIKINAAISDANIPIQPEGTTQRLNEFDRVFIQITKGSHSVIAGDYELNSPPGYFSKYHKKLKGINYSDKFKLKNNYQIINDVSFAISKGKFSRNTLKVSNGNQGPYKLSGSQDERFLIVLSGTEKVYLDGKLLTRGWDHDYTIDYNLAEITFTPKVMITENSRIIVEFEYSDQNYLRTLYAVNSIAGDSIKNFYINLYNEMDSKTSQGLIELDSNDIAILSESGDDVLQNVRSGIRPVKEAENIFDKICYYKKYEPSIGDSILVYTSDPDSAKYFALFSEVGDNIGSYDIDNSIVNGRVYKWVGLNNGKYEPVIRLIPPEKKQLISFGSHYKLGKNTAINAEISISNEDKNRFSSIDDDDNTGMAGFLQMTTAKKIGIKSENLLVENQGKLEYAGINYNPVNPYRPPEFTRDWNIQKSNNVNNEYLLSNVFKAKISNFNFRYDYSGFFRGNIFTGNKHIPSINFNYKGLSVFAQSNILNTEDEDYKTNFFRPKINISQKISFLKNLKAGFYFEKEKNNINTKSTDSLTNRSFYYDFYKIYLNTVASKSATLNFYSSYREDYLPLNNRFEKYTGAFESGVQGNWNFQSISTLTYNITFRNLRIKNDISNIKKPESNLLGKLGHKLNLFKGAIRSNTNIEFGSGQLAKSDFVYLKVKPGEGSYVWLDYNKNGIEEKGEFEIIQGIDTANYVKVIQYNNEFVRTNSSLINNSLKISGNKFFKKPINKFNKFLSKLNFTSIFRMTQKTESNNNGYVFPVLTNLNDTSLISYNLFYNGVLFFNQGNPVYDIRLGYKTNANQPIQIEGYTKLGLKEYYSAVRYNYEKYMDLISKISMGSRWYESQSYQAKNYLFDYLSLSEEMNFFFSNKLGFKLNYNYSNKKNQQGNKEKALIHDLKFTGKAVNIKKFRIITSFSFVKIAFTGLPNTPVELAMLDGLKNGNNYLWGIKLSKRLKNNLDLIIQYDGRKTSESNVIHMAKMQARAIF